MNNDVETGEIILDEEANLPLEMARRLADIDFTDLSFSEAGEAWLRNVEGQDDPIVGVPESVLEDLNELHQRVCRRGQNEMEFFMDYDDMRFRVTRIDDVSGRWYTLRRAMYPIPRLVQLKGIPTKVIHALGLVARPPEGHGLIIIAGPTTAGKTTTACSLLQEYLLNYGDVAVTVEDPPELPLNGPHGRAGHCFQTQAPDGDFREGMRLTMRRAPRYILLGEVRGTGEADAAVRAANNGHVVITTIHAGSCIEAINSMLKFVNQTQNIELARTMLADGLCAVLCQRLVKVNGKRRIKLEYLFFGKKKDHGSRSLVRTGKTEQLSTAIAAQAAKVAQGQLPVDDDSD
jgi:twitching motility protein PilT